MSALEHQIPNPPAFFVGRTDELMWAQQRLDGGPLLVLCGPGGIGKTTFVSELLKRVGHLEDGVMIRVREEDPVEALVRTLIWVLDANEDAATAARDPEDGAALALRLAEARGAWVVIDDLHQCADIDAARDLLVQINTYARKSKWLVTSRRVPRDISLTDACIVLPPLSQLALSELGRNLWPDRDSGAIERAAAAAGGMPWVLRSERAFSGEWLDGVSTSARFCLDVLTPVRTALSETTCAQLMSRFGGDVDLAGIAATLAELAQRGLVVWEGGGWRAHDMARMIARPVDPSLLADGLARSSEPAAWLEAVRLELSRGATDAARELLDRRGQTLLLLGEAPRLWRVLAVAPAESLDVWRQRCAAELGNTTVVQAAGHETMTSEWGRMLLLLGDAKGAQQVAQRIGDAGLHASALLALGRYPEASSFGTQAGRYGTVALANAIGTGAFDDGAIPHPLPEEPEEQLALAQAMWWTGQVERSEALLRDLAESSRGSRTSILFGRRVSLALGWHDLDAGRLDEVSARLESFRPFLRGPSRFRADVALLRAELCLARGPFEGLEDSIAHVIPIAAAADDATHQRLRAIAELIRERTTSGAGPERRRTIRSELAKASQLPPQRALQLIEGAARRAAEASLATVECEALSAQCEVLSEVSDRAALLEIASMLGERADRHDALRYQAIASFYLERDRPSRLERTATLNSLDPQLARCARSLLGYEGEPLPGLRTLGPIAWQAGWGFDLSRKSVWRADGVEIDLGRRPLLVSILDVLFRAGGSATKEQLVEDVWGERTYHPGRHDSKLYVAIRNLRKSIEPDPSSPTLVLTVDQGYQLGLPARCYEPMR